MRCATCGYRQRTRYRMGDRVWIRWRGEYVPGVVEVSQGPTPDYADLYLVVAYETPLGEVRSLLPSDDRPDPVVLPWEPPF